MKSLAPLWLFLSGCAAQPHVPAYHYSSNVGNAGKPKEIWVWIDQGFEASDHLAIVDAITAWNKTLNGFVELKSVDYKVTEGRPELPRDRDWVIVNVKLGSPMLAKSGEGQTTIGTADFVGGHNIFMAGEAMKGEDIYYVSLHEIGHLLGADHRGEKLMYPTYTPDRFHCIDYLTASQVADWQNIPVRNMNYCMRY